MILKNLRLIIFVLILLVVQFLINNLSVFYVDLLGIVLIILLVEGKSSWFALVLLSLVADLFGHWYLGSHLFAIVILSIFSSRVNRFYQLCGWFNRSIIADFFFLLMSLIIYLIDILIAKTFASVYSITLELVLLMPLIQFILNYFVNLKSTEFIWYE